MKQNLPVKGPEAGWTWGGFGSLIWLPILAVVFLCKGKVFAGTVTFLLFAGSVFYVIRYAPWKYPDTPLWKIYLGLAALLILSVIVIYSLWIFGTAYGYQGLWQIVYLLSVFLIPVFVFGNRSWRDMHGGEKEKPE